MNIIKILPIFLSLLLHNISIKLYNTKSDFRNFFFIRFSVLMLNVVFYTYFPKIYYYNRNKEDYAPVVVTNITLIPFTCSYILEVYNTSRF